MSTPPPARAAAALTTPHDGARVAYQGAPGAWGEHAARAHAGDAARPVPCRTFADVLAAVIGGEADTGVLPITNTVIGAVREACDALAAAGGAVERVGEVDVPVRHAVLALPGATLDGLRVVASHPAALAQCSRFLAGRPLLRAIEAWDTAGAAADLARLARPGQGTATWAEAVPGARPTELAVLASPDAAAPLGLVVIAEAVQDAADNVTRFAVVRASRARA